MWIYVKACVSIVLKDDISILTFNYSTAWEKTQYKNIILCSVQRLNNKKLDYIESYHNLDEKI